MSLISAGSISLDSTFKFMMWKVKSVSQPDTIALLGINNCLQITGTGVRWVVLCLSQDGACTDSFENFRDNSLKGGLFNDYSHPPPSFLIGKYL
jgi:hypothetical protein